MADIVPGHGNRHAKILVLGEAPAANEAREGIPFVGQAGQEMDRMLFAAGLRRADVYVTNASLRIIRGDKDSHFFASGRPSVAYIEGIAALRADLASIRPNVVVALGNWALLTMMGHAEIMKWRGSVLWSDMHNVKVVPSIHPAALLRGRPDDAPESQGGMWKMRTVVVWDLMKAKAESAYPDLRRRQRRIIVNPTGIERDTCIHRVLTSKRIVYDEESYGGLSLACVGYSDGDPEWAFVMPVGNDREAFDIHRMIMETDIPKTGQNVITYDVTADDQRGINTRGLDFDTMVAGHVLNPQLPKKLEFLTSVYTDIPYYKFEGQVWKKQPLGPDLQMFYNYCGKDVCATAEIEGYQRQELTDRKQWGPFKTSMEIVDPFRVATKLGCKVDLHKLLTFINETSVEAVKVHEEIEQLVGHAFNPRSTQQTGKILYDERKIPERKKKGKRTTDAKQLLDIAAQSDDPVPRLIVKYRRLEKLLSNYYNVDVLSPDGRVRATWNPAGTAFGRASSSAPLWGPGWNFQNLPYRHNSHAREIVVADDGFEFWEFDQVQAEAVIVAYAAGDPIHMDCFRTGKDVHRVTACLLTDQPVEKWKDIPKPSQIRDLSKVANHELNYGAGPYMFMFTVNSEYDPDDPMSVKLDKKTSKFIYDKYHEIRPALRGYWDTIKQELRNNSRTLKTYLGREIQFLDQWSDSMLRQAYSAKPQGTVGEATNVGILQAYDSEDLAYLFKHDCRLVNQGHDSSTWQVPQGAREYAAKFMKTLEVPLYINGYQITIAIEGAAGPNMYKGSMESLGVSRLSPED